MTDPHVAVVGCGYWGKNLVRNFAALGALRTVCDADAVRLAAIKAQKQFADWALVKMGRLSVVPTTHEQWKKILEMAGG